MWWGTMTQMKVGTRKRAALDTRCNRQEEVLSDRELHLKRIVLSPESVFAFYWNVVECLGDFRCTYLFSACPKRIVKMTERIDEKMMFMDLIERFWRLGTYRASLEKRDLAPLFSDYVKLSRFQILVIALILAGVAGSLILFRVSPNIALDIATIAIVLAVVRVIMAVIWFKNRKKQPPENITETDHSFLTAGFTRRINKSQIQ